MMLHDVTNNQWGVRSYQISETYENHQEPSRTTQQTDDLVTSIILHLSFRTWVPPGTSEEQQHCLH